MVTTPMSKPPVKRAIRRVPFVVKAAEAGEVRVTGDFTAWAKEGVLLKKGPNGDWSTTLELAPGEYQYRLLIDGEWRDHAEAAKRVPNPYGSENGVITIP